jgi:hypothetical protein
MGLYGPARLFSLEPSAGGAADRGDRAGVIGITQPKQKPRPNRPRLSYPCITQRYCFFFPSLSNCEM